MKRYGSVIGVKPEKLEDIRNCMLLYGRLCWL